MKRRKTTALDRAVIQFQKLEKPMTFERIYHAIFPTVEYLAKKYAYLFPDMSVDDLMQEGYLHITTKVIPVYDAERASFKTLATISIRNRFRQLLKKIRQSEEEPLGIPPITFTEYEFSSGLPFAEFQDAKHFVDEILVADFLRLFKERLTQEHWDIYWRIYKDPDLKFRSFAEEMDISMASLYRRCRTIYFFLKLLIEKESDDG